MSPNRPRGQTLRRFPEPSAKRPLSQIKGAEPQARFGQLCGQIHHDLLAILGGLEAPQHGTHCPQAPWPQKSKGGLKGKGYPLPKNRVGLIV